MNTPIACLLAAGLMPYLWTATAKVIGGRTRRFNNRDARAWQAGLTGLPARAHAAHLNSFEAFPLFATAVLLALHQNAPMPELEFWAICFVLLRLLYGACYLADWATPRSLVWLGGISVTVKIFLMSAG